jgi:hypothetical protein
MRRFFSTKRHSIQVKLRVAFIKQIADKVNTFRSSHGVIGSEIQISARVTNQLSHHSIYRTSTMYDTLVTVTCIFNRMLVVTIVFTLY